MIQWGPEKGRKEAEGCKNSYFIFLNNSYIQLERNQRTYKTIWEKKSKEVAKIKKGHQEKGKTQGLTWDILYQSLVKDEKEEKMESSEKKEI